MRYPAQLSLTLATLLIAAPMARAADATRLATPPRTPDGMQQCTTPMIPTSQVVPRKGERFLYDVELLGVGVGTVNVQAMRRGAHQGKTVTEYRAWVDPDPLVGSFVKLEGQVAALVPDGRHTAVQSRVNYRFRKDDYSELQTFRDDGSVVGQRKINGKSKTFERAYGGHVLDFLSAFNLLRRLPADKRGCAVIYSGGKSFTVWVVPEGAARVYVAGKTRAAQRYLLRYGSDRSKKIESVRLWLSAGAERLMYRAEAMTRYSPVIELRAYRPGRRS